jgi:hypothetical protein
LIQSLPFSILTDPVEKEAIMEAVMAGDWRCRSVASPSVTRVPLLSNITSVPLEA